MNIQQVFLMTTLVWLVLPVFAALPFWIGAPGAHYTNAFFEAMSGLTTTGSTVFIGLAGAEFVAVGKLGVEEEGLDQLLDGFEIAELARVGLGEGEVIIRLLRLGRPL